MWAMEFFLGALAGGAFVFGVLLQRMAEPLARLKKADPVAYAALVRKATRRGEA
jgi:hypothetical protein